jgi:hypothetical protein
VSERGSGILPLMLAARLEAAATFPAAGRRVTSISNAAPLAPHEVERLIQPKRFVFDSILAVAPLAPLQYDLYMHRQCVTGSGKKPRWL